jgi:hypothetical protein
MTTFEIVPKITVDKKMKIVAVENSVRHEIAA